MKLPSPRRPLVAAALASAGALMLPAAADANLVAAYDHAVPGGGLDIGLVDINARAPIPVPAGVNTPADETHPSLSADASQLVFQRRGITVRVPLRPAGPPVTTSPLAGTPPLATPSLSPDGAREITARGALQPDGRSIGTPGKRGVVTVSGSAGEFPAPMSAPYAQPGGGTADPSIDSGANPVMAWSTSRVAGGRNTWDLDLLQFTAPGFQGTLNRLAGLVGTDRHAYLQGTARFGVVTFVDVPIGPDGRYGPGDLGTLFSNGAVSMYPSGSPSDRTKINTPLDERAVAYSGDGRYMGFLRRGPDGRVVLEVFDGGRQRLLDRGIDLGFDPDSNARRVNTGLSLALDPTRFHSPCVNPLPGVQCLRSNARPRA
ncbi:MAG TPA: hypothetical protein VN213_11580 [Solirubrobacteraceae bacterium]|nr:hypothetical protein [Solirubrobacteraceae bacterium]